jgi:hypothetical protein
VGRSWEVSAALRPRALAAIGEAGEEARDATAVVGGRAGGRWLWPPPSSSTHTHRVVRGGSRAGPEGRQRKAGRHAGPKGERGVGSSGRAAAPPSALQAARVAWRSAARQRKHCVRGVRKFGARRGVGWACGRAAGRSAWPDGTAGAGPHAALARAATASSRGMGEEGVSTGYRGERRAGEGGVQGSSTEGAGAKRRGGVHGVAGAAVGAQAWHRPLQWEEVAGSFVGGAGPACAAAATAATCAAVRLARGASGEAETDRAYGMLRRGGPRRLSNIAAHAQARQPRC